jgi:hypothetical protein
MTTDHNQLEPAIERVVAELREGLRHGFFEYRLIGEIVSGRKRQLILEAGKKYRFTTPEEDLKQRDSGGNGDS